MIKEILIIEDDPIIDEQLKEKIEKGGFHLNVVKTAEEGLKWLDTSIPFLFILEYNLPEKNGQQFIQELKSRLKSLPPFIVIAKNGNERSAIEMMKLGAKDYFVRNKNLLENLHLLLHRIWTEIEYENKLIKTEEALKESYLFNDQIISGANIGIIVYDLNLRYRVWNPYMERLSGYPATWIIGKDPFAVFPFLEKIGAKKYFERVLQGEVVPPVDYQFEIAEIGRKGWASDTSSPLYNSEGKIIGVISTLVDITSRKEMEESLRMGQRRLRQIIDLVPHYIYAKDSTGKFILANQAVANLYGRSVKEIKGLNDKFFNKFDREESQITDTLDEKTTYEEIIIDLKGNIRCLESTRIPYKTVKDEIEAELGISIDITRHKEDEELINKFSETIKQSPNTIIITDSNGNIEYTNPRFSFINGYSAEEVKGWNLRQLKTEGHEQESYNEIWRTISSGKVWKGEFSKKTKDGRFILEQSVISPIKNGRGKITNFLVIVEDVTALKENELQLKTLIQNIPDAIIFKDGNKRWLEANKAAISLFDLENVDYRGKTAEELFEWSSGYEKLSETSGQTDEVAFKLEATLSMEENIPPFDENMKTYEFTKVPLFHSDGSRKGMIVIGRDITERIYKEKELIKAKEKAEESDRFKTAFLQNISHEIRTPMNAIIGFAKMLGMPGISSDKQKYFTSIINNNANQLLSIITNVLTISSLELHKEDVFERKVNINSLILNLLNSYESVVVEKGIALSIIKSLSFGQSEVYTDKTKLTQILNNLLNNAFKFTNHGLIELGYELKPSNEGGSQNELEFFVKDTGIGIEEEWYDRIFDRFVQVDLLENRKYGGNGIGLSISKGFVELMGGRIWVESEKNKGSKFCFTIPYKPVDARISGELNEDDENEIPKVLVAEDIEFNYILIEEILKGLNYSLIHARDGNEAIEICKANTDIQLILMDIKMPVLDGYSAAKLIKEFRPGIPIIAQTAYALDNEVARYGDAFNDYISKPINVEELTATLKKYVHQ
jgi:PAS domain S-box-containing protein